MFSTNQQNTKQQMPPALPPTIDAAAVRHSYPAQPLPAIPSRLEQNNRGPSHPEEQQPIDYNMYPIFPPTHGSSKTRSPQLENINGESPHSSYQPASQHLVQRPLDAPPVPAQSAHQLHNPPYLLYSYLDPRTNQVLQLAVPTVPNPHLHTVQSQVIRPSASHKTDVQPSLLSSVGSASNQSSNQSTHQPPSFSFAEPLPVRTLPDQPIPHVQHGEPVIQTPSMHTPGPPPAQPIPFVQLLQVQPSAQSTHYPLTNLQHFPSAPNMPHSAHAGSTHQIISPEQQALHTQYTQPMQCLPTQNAPHGLNDLGFVPKLSLSSAGPSLYGLSGPSSMCSELQTQPSAMWLLPDQAHAATASVPTLSNAPASEVRLEISAKNILNRDVFSKSDPVAVVFEEVRTPSAPKNAVIINGVSWVEVGRTESMRDNLNPHFRQQVSVLFHFEELQRLRIALWDIDGMSSEFSRHDFLGEAYVTLGDLVASGKWTGPLGISSQRDSKVSRASQNHGLGTLTVYAHERRSNHKMAVDIVLRASKLSRTDIFGKSDAYVVITTLGDKEGSKVHLGKSELVRKNSNPFWRPMHLRVDVRTGYRKEDIRLNFEVLARGKFSLDSEIGSAEANIATLESRPKLELVNMKNRSKGYSKSSGILIVESCSSMNLPSFVEYLQGGLHLNFTVAVDLTQSNGDPSKPDSLHYRHSATGSNSYLKALTAVWKVIEPYFGLGSAVCAYGFGADINGTGSASHCFNLGLGSSPFHRSLDEVVASYSRTLAQVRLYGPTNFEPVLRQTMERSKRHRQSQDSIDYDVVLILTDGCVTDFNNTVDALIDASITCPLSVVIIGIGNEDFSMMEQLDSDNEILVSRTDTERRARRDIVQFVPYRRFEKGLPEQLAAHVLAEVPDNIIEYFTTLSPPILPVKRVRSFDPTS